MGTLVQIRDVPEDVHRTLKSRAALQGVSLSEYLRGELQRIADRPTPAELQARLARRQPVRSAESSAQAIREPREEGSW